MKNYLLALSLISASILSSCSDAIDPEKCLNSVKEKFPHAKVYSTYGNNITFIVVDSAQVRMVKTGSIFHPSITSVEILSEQ